MDAFGSILSSSVLTGLDLFKPEHNARLFRPYGDQGASWFITLQILGSETPVASEDYHSWEEGRIHESFKIRANVADPGAGNDLVIVVAVANVTADNKFYPQVGDDIKLANQVSGYIRSIDVSTPANPTLTIAVKSATETFGAVTAGDDVVIYSNSWGEAGDQPVSRVSKPTKRTGHLTLIKTRLSASGSEMANDVWVNVVDNKGFQGWYNKTRDIDLSFRHNLAISHKLLVDELVTNTTKVVDASSTAGSAVAYGTEGLITAMDARAIPYVKASGALVMDDFYAMNLALTKQHNGSDVIGLCGNKRMQNVIKILFAANYNTGVDWTKATMDSGIVGDEGDARARAMAIDVKTLDIDGRRWHFKNMNEFNNPETLGIDSFPYRDMMAVVPTGKVPDAKSRSLIPYSGVRYKALGNYNRRLQIWTGGASGKDGVFVGSLDVRHDDMRSHLGTEHVCLNKYLLVKTA